jgi:WD40 repeat protein
MIDALTGKCVECFRTTHSDNHDVSSSRDALPDLVDISLEMKSQRNIVAVSPFQEHSIERHTSTSSQINCLVGSIGQNQSYLITGDSDSNITFWDFASPSKCYVVSGPAQAHMRPSFERLDVERNGRLMLCRMPRHAPPLGVNRLLKRELQHSDSIQDLKIVNNNLLVTCSRDKTIKVWR